MEVGGGVEVWWCSREFRSSMTWLWRAARKISEGSSWAGCESEWLWRAARKISEGSSWAGCESEVVWCRWLVAGAACVVLVAGAGCESEGVREGNVALGVRGR